MLRMSYHCQTKKVLTSNVWYGQNRNPMVTGTSVLGVKFNGGVLIAADMLGSYGSLARFRNISRLMKVMLDAADAAAVWRWRDHQTTWLNCVCVSGEQQYHPWSIRGLRRLPAPEACHWADGVSYCCCCLLNWTTFSFLFFFYTCSILAQRCTDDNQNELFILDVEC